MNLVRLVIVCLAATCVVACKSPEPGEPAAFAEVCGPKFDPAPNGDLKRVSVEGYLGIPGGLFVMCSDTCGMVLRANPTDKEGLRVNLRVGGSKNQMEKLPKDFSEKDLSVTTAEGKTVGVGAKVRVTGGRLGGLEHKDCQLYKVDLIQAL
ncbi:MAG: hypothetical protein IPI67_03510 [Myxococcales bacterium]|nr:hypothetical protein [Myxococcales bacterium]